MDRSPLLAGLDARQRAAVTDPAAPLAIIAAAGSGKTTVLTRRIAHRISTDEADASHVLALTFTRQAAYELTMRLRRLGVVDRIETGTFHAVALRLLRDRALARNESMPSIVHDRLRLLRECITELKLGIDPYHAAADIDWARARCVPAERYEAANRAARRQGALTPSRYIDLVAAYERIKRRRGVVDFDDLLVRTVEAIDSDRQFAETVHWRFRHLFVDEAQDLNPLQHRLLEAWRGGRPDLCLVGDPRQAIYGWNGADHTVLTKAEERYSGITIVRLDTNYRCTPQIVSAGRAALAATDQVDDTTSARPDGPSVTIDTYADAAAEASAVADRVRAVLNHHRLGAVAVLARTNQQLTVVAEALRRRGVAVDTGSGVTPLDRILAEAFRCAGADALMTWVELATASVDPLRRRVGGEADRYLVSGDRGTFRTWVDLRQPFDEDEQPASEPGVALQTFHAAKGREWECVFLIGVEAGLVPHGSAMSADGVAEESRLLYVAVTRAATSLVITASEQRNDRPTTPSPWLEAIAETAAADAPIPPPRSIKRVPATDPIAALRTWRAGIARLAGVDPMTMYPDRVLRSLVQNPPTSLDQLAGRLGVTPAAAARLAPVPGLPRFPAAAMASVDQAQIGG